MKKIFIETLTLLARKDKDIYLLTGDLGFSAFEDFAKEFPERFIDCGVAEQNMAGVAAGLALSGKKPYIYSIIPFITMRCFEQIRNNICYQNLNVKIIGIGAGFSYDVFGSTHHALEDISIFRSLPNITILSPADAIEAEQLIIESYKKNTPAYIRLDKTENFLINKKTKIKISKPNIVKQGKDALVITTGNCLGQAIEAVKKIEEKGFTLKIISLHTLKPINENLIIKEFENIKYLFAIEEHRKTGGLTSLISEIIAQNNICINFSSFALPINHKHVIGERDFLKKYYKQDKDNIYKNIIKILDQKNGK